MATVAGALKAVDLPAVRSIVLPQLPLLPQLPHLPHLDPEPVITGLSAEVYQYKCLVLLLQVQNSALKARLERFVSLASEAGATA